MYSFFSGTRNEYNISPIAKPRGIPKDACDDTVSDIELLQDEGLCDPSWLLVSELTQFDYEQTFINNKTNPPTSMTYRDFLSECFFEHLEILKGLGNPQEMRIVFVYT